MEESGVWYANLDVCTDNDDQADQHGDVSHREER